MSEKDRNVKITIGDKDYSIRTSLDETVLNRVLDHIEEAVSETEGGQEQKLLAACLDLAYKLEIASNASTDNIVGGQDTE